MDIVTSCGHALTGPDRSEIYPLQQHTDSNKPSARAIANVRTQIFIHRKIPRTFRNISRGALLELLSYAALCVLLAAGHGPNGAGTRIFAPYGRQHRLPVGEALEG